MSPRVSVVIPAYNAAEFIAQTVDSVLAQTFADLEILVVDDGSTDATADILRAYGPPVAYVSQSNAGVSAARNAALAMASGELVAFLDHDDVWEPSKLQLQVELLDSSPELGAVYANCWFIDAAGRKLWRYLGEGRACSGRVLPELFLDCFVPMLTFVARAEVLREIGPLDRRWFIAEDYDLFLRVAERYPIGYVDALLAGYRIHPSNVARDLARRLREEREVLSECLDRSPTLRTDLGQGAIAVRMAGLRCTTAQAAILRGDFVMAGRARGAKALLDLPVACGLGLAALFGPDFVFGLRTTYRRFRETWNRLRIRSGPR